MMFVADLGRAGLTALIPLSVALGGPTMAVILLVAAPMASSARSSWPATRRRCRRSSGAARSGGRTRIFEVIYSMGFILGPAIAGVLAATIGPGPTLAIDAAVVRALRASVCSSSGATCAPRSTGPAQPLLTEIREGIDFIVAQPDPADVDPVLGRDLDPARAAGHRPDGPRHARPRRPGRRSSASSSRPTASGRVVGSLLTARWIGRGRVAEMLLGGNFVMGIALIVLAVTVELPVQLAVAFVAGIAQSMVLVTYLTLRTVHSPDELLGRIGSTARTISLGLQPVGLLVGGALIDLTSGSTTMALMGIAVAAVSLPSPRSRRSASATLVPELRDSGGAGERVVDRGRARPRRGWRTRRTRTRRARRPRRLPDRRTMGIRCRTSRTSPSLRLWDRCPEP